MASLPPRGAWIEITHVGFSWPPTSVSLPPRGAWIEMSVGTYCIRAVESLPPRGAWIEIMLYYSYSKERGCRSPRGERGLKCKEVEQYCGDTSRRSPRGERGLKFFCLYLQAFLLLSLPPRGAWIEICQGAISPCDSARRSPRGERGLKSRCAPTCRAAPPVAPPAGSVD